MLGNILINVVFSRVLRDSTPRFVGSSVRPSVRPSHFTFFVFFFVVFGLTAPAQVTSNMAPAHPHATGVAVYLTLLIADTQFYKSFLLNLAYFFSCKIKDLNLKLAYASQFMQNMACDSLIENIKTKIIIKFHFINFMTYLARVANSMVIFSAS